MNSLLKFLLIFMVNLLCSKAYSGGNISTSNEKTQLNFIEYKTMSYYINLESKLNPEVNFKQPVLKDYKHVQGFFCDFEDNISKNRKFKLDLGITGVQ